MSKGKYTKLLDLWVKGLSLTGVSCMEPKRLSDQSSDISICKRTLLGTKPGKGSGAYRTAS